MCQQYRQILCDIKLERMLGFMFVTKCSDGNDRGVM